MLVKLLSDLHMEGDKFKYEQHGEEAVILAGDIHTQNRLHLLLDQIPPYIQVFFVAGNHEYYRQTFEEVNEYLEGLEQKYNFIFLNNKMAKIGNIPIFGGTMFTDFLLDGETARWFAEHDAQQCIADFACIQRKGDKENRDWRIADHKAEFEKFRKELTVFITMTEGSPKRMVVTHFIPHPKSVHPRFARSNLNPYFTADMEKYLGWDGWWLHGHGHDTFEYKLGDTQVYANPRGYATENQGGFRDNFVFEI